ncbi:alpha/beta hydrolase [Kordia algicida OT-1]|uniref:Hydrolase, alpha/beta hydrolase fold family protein n=1 Tax=Kordia algicida OT-1 TaxID=391587 RepID=A9DSX8_9FLAO|nr:alpha/beta hydrolase [Kordia algicida]EDP96996.1 hydrolase, alpha/beta hydrolase fold family protein [Kordia algicida OT-1]
MQTFRKLLIASCLFITFSTIAQEKSFQVKIIGKGNPILLFPGFSCTGDVWNETVKELSKTHECHIFTFAGFGNVPAIETPWLTTIKNDLENYVTRKKLKKPTIIGHSMGGSLALWLASENPNTYKELIIVDGLPSIGALMIPDFSPDKVSYDNPFAKQQLEMDETAFKQMATQMAAGMTKNEEKQPQIVSWMLQADRKTYVYGYIDLMKLDLRESIKNIKIPVTIMAAVSFYPKPQVEKLYTEQYQKLDKKKIIYVDNSAHFIMFDKTDWFVKEVRKLVVKR